MRAFVTGGTGLLGNNLVRGLLAQGHKVCVLVRSPEKASRTFGALPVEVVQGDMGDVPGFAEALQGADVLFHTAAYFREYYRPGEHEDKLEAINVEGALTLFRAAQARGVRRIVHTSSSGVIGPGPGGAPGDETCAPSAESMRNRYFASKVRADERVRDAVRSEGLPVVTILPGWMFGPGDLGPTSAGRVVLDFLHGRLPAVPPGGACATDARDVASAMIAMAERAPVGDRTLVAGPYTTLRELFTALERVSGVRAPGPSLPYPAALAMATVAQTASRWLGVESAMSVEGIRSLRAAHPLSAAKARRELGLTCRPLDETLADVVAYYRASGLAPALTASGAPKMAS
jgi:dihydroflavonol-4-reductase